VSPIVLKGKSVAKTAGKAPASASTPAASAGAAEGDKPVCDKSVPPIPVGDCDYYQKRHDNFLSRHRACPHRPPDYYIAYGKKYCVKFSTDLYPKLSQKGKEWLVKAKFNLQTAIESGLASNPAIELDNEGFRKFAFGTHADAYWSAGLHDVSIPDKVKIGLTPDMKEWMSGDTWSQAGDIVGREGRAYGKDAGDWAGRVSEDVKDYFRRLFK
jgi:hypothetical protein